MLLKRNIALLLAAAILVLAGCPTTVTLSVKRTPNLNTSGIDRIAILPFTTGDRSQLQREAATALTQTATNKIQATNHFTMVAAAQVQSLVGKPEIENYVDGLLTGQVTRLEIKNTNRVVERVDKDGNKYNVTIYEKRMDMAFSYSLMRARDGSIVGVKTRTGSDTDSAENNSGGLRSDSQMIARIVDRQLGGLSQDVAPYTVSVRRGMMTDKGKGLAKADQKLFQAKMKNANNLVKQGAYKQAIDAFLNTYDQFGYLAPGYNAVVMYEAMGDLSEAYGLIEFLVGEFPGNNGARSYMNELATIIKDQELLATVFVKGASTAKQKVTDLTINEIKKVVPRGTKVWVFNNTPVASTAERKLAADVVDNVTSALFKAGITIVDRENSKLIDAEQRFQMSGAVSDNDFMSIGNAAGASVLINIGVVGAGSNRRLQVQVMDMEKRTYSFRSEASADWSI